MSARLLNAQYAAQAPKRAEEALRAEYARVFNEGVTNGFHIAQQRFALALKELMAEDGDSLIKVSDLLEILQMSDKPEETQEIIVAPA